MALNTRTQIPIAVREFYIRELLMTAFPNLVQNRWAQKRTIPRKSGDTAVFRRYTKLDPAVVPLQDGITPPGASISQTTFSVRASEYGNYVMYSDEVDYLVEDKVLAEFSKLLGQNMGQSMDQITRDVLVTCTTSVQAASGSNGNTPTEITQADIDIVTRTLLGNDAKMITEMQKGSVNFATVPLRPAFWGVIHTDLLSDLENCDGFVPASNYGRDQQEYEWGQTKNVRWVYSSIAAKSSASPAVYSLPILGQEAYGTVHIGPEGGELMIKALGSAGTADALDQRGSIGWKNYYAARILNDSFMAILEVTAA